MTGGSTAGYSTGLEAWNAETGTVETLSDQLWIEKTTGWSKGGGLSMAAINANTELVYFGGFPVYKYNYPQNKWTFLGNSQYEIDGPFLIPVVGLECP